ncbi:MAG: carboxypeptidase-like regulatory domain-containing protein [Bacteroidales bacterium]
MKIKKYFFVSFLSILLSLPLYSQHTVCGKVINQKGEPLYPANIKLKNSTIGTSSENDGSFCIHIPAKSEIKISFVGYESTTIKMNILDTVKTIFKTIILTAKSVSLPEFEVNSTQLITVTKEKNIFVRDYEFMGNNILTLIIKENERKLSFITLDDSLIWETNLTNGMFRCTKFYKDFLSNTYLLSDDSAFQITNKDNEIYFFPGVAIADFNKTIIPSLAMCDQKIVYRVYGSYYKSVYYFLIKEGKKRLLFSTKDVESEIYCNDIFNEILSNPTPPFAKYEGNMRMVTDYFNYDYFKKILVQPIETHLFNIDDSIYVFDHFKSKMYVYNYDAKLLNEIMLYYPKRQDFVAKQLILANNKKDVYAVFNNDGLYTIQQIDLKTGKLKGNEIKINYPFVEKIRIHGNQIYFLYKQNNDDGKKLLYKLINL